MRHAVWIAIFWLAACDFNYLPRCINDCTQGTGDKDISSQGPV